MKKTIIAILTACLVSPFANAQQPNIIDRGNAFLVRNVYTDPVTERSKQLLYGEFVLSLVLSAGLYKLDRGTTNIKQERIAAVSSANAKVLELSSRQVELANAIEVTKSELKPLEAKFTLLQDYLKNPAQSLSNLEKALIRDLAETSNSLATMKAEASISADLVKNQILAGEEVPAQMREGFRKQSEAIKKISAQEIQLKNDLESVRASLRNGNRLPAAILNSDEIIKVTRSIHEKRSALAAAEVNLQNNTQALESAKSELSAAARSVSRQGAVSVGRNALKALGVLANLLVLADAFGNLYVINVLNRDPELSSLNTLANNPAARAKIQQMVEGRN